MGGQWREARGELDCDAPGRRVPDEPRPRERVGGVGEMVEERVEALRKLKHAGSKMMNRRLALGFGGWLDAYEAAKNGETTEAAMARAMKRLMQIGLAKGLDELVHDVGGADSVARRNAIDRAEVAQPVAHAGLEQLGGDVGGGHRASLRPCGGAKFLMNRGLATAWTTWRCHTRRSLFEARASLHARAWAFCSTSNAASAPAASAHGRSL